jgi:hypothetical protein
MLMSDGARAHLQDVAHDSLLPPSGPDASKPLLKSVSGAHALEMSRSGGRAAASHMETLAPHTGFQAAAALR